jgi:hypothetical protein
MGEMTETDQSLPLYICVHLIGALEFAMPVAVAFDARFTTTVPRRVIPL